MTAPVVVAIGSNSDDPVAQVRRALGRLAALSPGTFLASSLWESSPVDCPPGSPPFVNAVVRFDPPQDLSPESLLDLLLNWESEAGRRRGPVPHAPRPLDLDLIAFGLERRATPRLTLPHPRAHRRRFVLQPLSEIAPDLVLPGWTASTRNLLAALEGDEVLRRLPDP
ncbi:MAG: 2-amino-4-hydroxy-6-hydroxymethyldihydropteridine diphosphokinase [Verrucomicrobiae bacterium]|nr:2-amino-4-hydroxy-6-hydroxymethyldihydropteridine diphosphokinase [Verrucomicrobiae bacterium]